MNEKKKANKLLIVISGVFVGIMIGSLSYLYQKDFKRNRSYAFYGEVEQVRYDTKGFPYVTVNKVTYYLSYNDWNFNHCIEQHDSIQKLENSTVIKIKKRKSGQILVFGQ
jgi:hypothetical protein